ncbi:MAG: sulfatase [Planctomycetes bacterium]|nr:sulfatase [Planctomycetota bacterium]
MRYHMIWMSPTMNVAILGIVGLVVLPVVVRLSRLMAIRITCVLLGSASFLNFLCLPSQRTFSRIHFFPKVILAVGLAIVLQGLIRRRMHVLERFVRCTTIGLVLLVLVVAGSIGGWQHFREHRLISSLPDSSSSAPNVLLIVWDTVRAESMSLYGYQRPTTPFLKSIAEQGVVFQRAIAPCSWTLPSYASLYTGRLQYETGANWSVPLDSKYPTLAEVLSNRGYVTTGFMANTRYCNAGCGIARGFSHYEDQILFGGKLLSCSSLIRFTLNQNWFRKLIGYDLLGRKRAERITDDFLRWLDISPDNHPFFASLNYYDAHQPYLPPKEFDEMFGSTDRLRAYFARQRQGVICSPGNTSTEEIEALYNAYDASIAYMDSDLKRLFGGLRQRGLLDRTLVIITSDHGEEFGEHSSLGHGWDLHIQSIKVPLILRLPGIIPDNVTVQKPVALRNIPTTVIDILGLPDDDLFPGRSLSKYWTDVDSGGLEPSESILSELTHAPWAPEWSPSKKGNMKSLVTGDMHYIRNGDGTEEIYDFHNDPSEQDDLIQTPRGVDAAAKARDVLKQMKP